MRTQQSSCPRQSNQLHNAHRFEAVMVYYRWHPLFRHTLRVQKRMKDRHGEHIFCKLLDGTVCSLPSWMFRPECAYLTLGSPIVSVEALAALRDLLDTLRARPQCDMHSLDQSSEEGVNETPAMPSNMQLTLPLPNAPAAAIPSDKQRELSLALVELLLSAARESEGCSRQGAGA